MLPAPREYAARSDTQPARHSEPGSAAVNRTLIRSGRPDSHRRPLDPRRESAVWPRLRESHAEPPAGVIWVPGAGEVPSCGSGLARPHRSRGRRPGRRDRSRPRLVGSPHWEQFFARNRRSPPGGHRVPGEWANRGGVLGQVSVRRAWFSRRAVRVRSPGGLSVRRSPRSRAGRSSGRSRSAGCTPGQGGSRARAGPRTTG
jgi:hypothetical protein